MDGNMITLIDDDGNERDFEIILTFESDETASKYVFYCDTDVEEDEDVMVMVSRYDDDNNIYEITDPEELDMVEEVFNTFNEEQGLSGDE